jgi:hypothetical protein
MLDQGIKAKDKTTDYWEVRRDGKSYARWEVVVVFTVVYVSIVVFNQVYLGS